MIRKVIAYTSIVCILFCLVSCKGGDEKAKQMVGDWKVQWITYPEEGKGPDPTVNLTMNGLMEIKEDGKITIHAYGYEGCIFGGDTLVHTLNWELKGDTLNMTNDQDKFGIPYIIKDFSEDKVKLQLVEDVFLFLTK